MITAAWRKSLGSKTVCTSVLVAQKKTGPLYFTACNSKSIDQIGTEFGTNQRYFILNILNALIRPQYASQGNILMFMSNANDCVLFICHVKKNHPPA